MFKLLANVLPYMNEQSCIEFNKTIPDVEERGYVKYNMAMVNQREEDIGH